MQKGAASGGAGPSPERALARRSGSREPPGPPPAPTRGPSPHGKVMTTERIVPTVAGIFVLLSIALGAEASPLFVNRAFLWLAVFVGANLLQSGFTSFCPLAILLRKAGVRSAATPAP